MSEDWTKGPFLAMAVFCERVLQDQDGMLTPVRIVEELRIVAPPAAPAEMPVTLVQFTALVGLRAVPVGKHRIGIRPTGPSGKPAESITVEVESKSAEAHAGVNSIITLAFPAGASGLYWFDIFLDDRQVARMPLMIRYSRLIEPTTGPPTPRDSSRSANGSSSSP